jgi:hypothetical protein
LPYFGDRVLTLAGKVSAVDRNALYQEFKESLVRILLVEDDPLIRESVVEALREEGYHVIHAANGEQALAWCGRPGVDVLITDVKLPGSVDGWQIAERYREHMILNSRFGGFLGIGDDHYPLSWQSLKYDTGLGGYRTNLTDRPADDRHAAGRGARESWVEGGCDLG